MELARNASAVLTRPSTADWLVAVKGLERAVDRLDLVPRSIGSIFNRSIPPEQTATLRSAIDDALLGTEIALQRLLADGKARPDSYDVASKAKVAQLYLRRLDDHVVGGTAGEVYRTDLGRAHEAAGTALTNARHEMRSSEHRQVGVHVARQVEEVFAELDRIGLDTAVPKELQVQDAVDGMLARGVIEA